jgi:hypothetical protein
LLRNFRLNRREDCFPFNQIQSSAEPEGDISVSTSQMTVKEPFHSGKTIRDDLIEEIRIELASGPLHGGRTVTVSLGPTALVCMVAILVSAVLLACLASGDGVHLAPTFEMQLREFLHRAPML